MGRFSHILARLRKEERNLEKQLKGIRTAISSLEFGTGGGVPPTLLKRGATGSRKSRRRKPSAAQPRAVSARRKYSAARNRSKR
jgi:hypothetical protein